MAASTKALPQSARDALTALSRLEAGAGGFEVALEAAVEEIARLDPARVADADQAIAGAAQLSAGQPTWDGAKQTYVSPPADEVRRQIASQLSSTPGLERLYLFHRSGYAREAALDGLDTPPATPFWHAAIVLRLNDWVPEVRAAALRCTTRMLRRTPPAIAAASLAALAPRLDDWTRWGPAEKDAVAEALDDPDVRRAFVDLLTGSELRKPTAVLRWALRGATLDGELIAIYRAAGSSQVRAAALSVLIAGSASWPIGYGWEWAGNSSRSRKRVPRLQTRPVAQACNVADLIREGVADRSALVRRAAVAGLLRQYRSIPDALCIAERLVTDRSSAVRWRAAYIVGRLRQ